MSDKNPFIASVARFFSKEAVYVVGGAVRDRLLGRPTSDIDLVVPHDPTEAAEKLAQRLGGKAFPLDAERGIIRVALADGLHLDLAQMQGGTLEADVDRRDFTLNALVVPLNSWGTPAWKSKILDRHEGLKHISKKQIIPVSKDIFDDDPLRLLRAFRIGAELGFVIPPTTSSAIAKKKALLKKPAPERIREELLRLFSTGVAYAMLQKMEATGILEVLLPEAKSLRRTAPAYYGKGGVLRHTLESVKIFEEILRDLKSVAGKYQGTMRAHLNEDLSGAPRLAHLKWGLLLHDIGKPATAKIIKGRLRFFEHEHVGADLVPALSLRFRWSAEETSRYARLVRNHMRPGNLASHGDVTDKAVHRFFRDLGDDAISMLLVSLADHLTYLTPKQRKKKNSPHEKTTLMMIRRYYLTPEKVLPPRVVSGFDIMEAFNLTPSPLIGELLTEVKEAQAEGKVKNRDQALNFVKGRLEKREVPRV